MKALLAVLMAATLSGCVAYPRLYWTKKTGQARLDNGKPIQIKAQILRYCDTLSGSSTDVLAQRSTMTDVQGRYSLIIRGLSWNWENLMTQSGCTSRVQLFVCRDLCRPADDIDINVLGK